jgi:hypothetical protein
MGAETMSNKINWAEIDPIILEGKLSYLEIAVKFSTPDRKLSANTIKSHAQAKHLNTVKRARPCKHGWDAIDPILAKVNPKDRERALAEILLANPTMHPATLAARYKDIRSGRHLSIEEGDVGRSPYLIMTREQIMHRNIDIKRHSMTKEHFEVWKKHQGPGTAFYQWVQETT